MLSLYLRSNYLTLCEPTLFLKLRLVKYMSQPCSLIMNEFAACLAHILLTILAISICVLFFTFRAQHAPSVLFYKLL